MNPTIRPSQCIIWAGGTSIAPEVETLKSKLQGKFVIGCNWMFKDLTPTILCFLDRPHFYELAYNDIKDLPLIIGDCLPIHSDKFPLHKNTKIIKKNTSVYTRDCSQGIYCGALTGIYALSLAIKLLDIGEIFLLGMDFSGKPSDKPLEIQLGNKKFKANYETEVLDDSEVRRLKQKFDFRSLFNFIKKDDKIERVITHYYQGDKTREHRGEGLVNYYVSKNPDEVFKPFENETKIKIYNVSPNSAINTFQKIDYPTFYSLVDNSTYDQDLLRNNLC